MSNLFEVVDYTAQLLDAMRFKDYCPNGLQVEGRSEIRKLVSGVTASQDLLQAALEAGADAILVHHGYFWRNEAPQIVGIKRKRLGLLIQNDISLIAYHLPLDAHQELGNNAQLGKRLGFEIEGWFGEQNIAAYGHLPQTETLGGLAERVGANLGRAPLWVGDVSRPIRRVAWCSGAAQDYLAEAIGLGVDVFITGEISEYTVHLARESGVAFISAGHHATERYGIQALGEHLAEHFGLLHQYIDIDNPV